MSNMNEAIYGDKEPVSVGSEAQKYDKEQLYEAFCIEVAQRKLLNIELNNERRDIALLVRRNDVMQQLITDYEDKLHYIEEQRLRLHIEKHVGIVSNVEATLDDYFNHPGHFTYYTSSGGYICVTDDGLNKFIYFMWTNPDHWGKEFREQAKLIKALYDKSVVPIRYTGTSNVLKNHSVELEDELWQVRLDGKFDKEIEDFKNNKGEE